LAYYHALEKNDTTYLASLEAPGVDVPPDMATDYRTLTRSQFALLIQDRRTSGSRSMASLNVHKKALARALDAVRAAANQVRADLNLPPAKPE
jgi:hypothetical protein